MKQYFHYVDMNYGKPNARPNFVNCLCGRHDTREEALEVERDSIIRERPLYNTIHNNGIKGLIKRMDKIVQYLVNHKNPITYKEEFHKQVQKWIDEYDSIKGMLDINTWTVYCKERDYHLKHNGYSFV